MVRRARGLATSIAFIAIVAACGGGTMQPCSGQSGQDLLCPTRGTAHVVVTGFEERTFDAPLDAQSNNPRPSLSQSLGVLQLAYRDRSKLPTDSFSFGGARTKPDAQQVGATILIHGSGYATLDGCTVTLTAFDKQGIAGSFTCTGVAPIGLEDSTTRLVNATGTFSASP